MDPKSGKFPPSSDDLAEFANLCRSKGWDPSEFGNFFHQNAEITPFSASMNTPPTPALSAINVGDYDVDEMHTVDELTPSPPVPAKGKGKGKKAAPEPTQGSKKYGPEENKILARCYVDVSEDPIIGNGQRVRIFWERIAERYNAMKPTWALERDYDHLRKHWGRVQAEVSKFAGYVNNLQKIWPSGHSWDNIREQAHATFYTEELKQFKYEEVWAIVRNHPKFCGGSDSGSGSKRTKHTASGKYTTSGEAEAFDLNASMDESVGTQQPKEQTRPMGQKAAKRKGKGKATTESQVPRDESLDKMSTAVLVKEYRKFASMDISHYTESQREEHYSIMAIIAKQLGL